MKGDVFRKTPLFFGSDNTGKAIQPFFFAPMKQFEEFDRFFPFRRRGERYSSVFFGSDEEEDDI